MGLIETSFNPAQFASSAVCLLCSGAIQAVYWFGGRGKSTVSWFTLVGSGVLGLGAVVWLGLITYYLAKLELMGH